LGIDTITGKEHKGFLVTVVDCKSKFTMIKNITTKHTDVVTQALIEMMSPVKNISHTIISDNGKEFAYHKQVAAALNTDFYFANPYHSRERGLNEHSNGLIRQYLPMKSTGYKTPYEVFFSEMSKRLAS